MGKSCGRRSTSGKSLADFAGVPQRAALCFRAALMFIHSGIRAKKQPEVCLLRLPNSHKGMLTHNTIVMQRDNWRQLPVLIANLLKLAYCLDVFEVSLKCCLQSWNAADMTFELDALEGRSWTCSTLTKGMLFRSCHPWHRGMQVLFS